MMWIMSAAKNGRTISRIREMHPVAQEFVSLHLIEQTPGLFEVRLGKRQPRLRLA